MSVSFDDLSPQEQAQYSETLQPGYYAGLSICTVSICIALGLRLYAQGRIGHLNALDSWMAILGFICTLAMNICNFAAVNIGGGGLHIWRVFVEDPSPPARLMAYHKSAYLLTVFNAPSYCFIKLSMLAFLHRIFASQRAWFKWTVYALAIYSIILGIANTVEFIVQCLPPSYFWERAILIFAAFTKKEPESVPKGWCMPQNVHTAVPLIAAMVSDVLLIALPWVGLWGVRLTRVKKAGIAFALSLGLFALALDAVRLWEVFQISNSEDITWNNTPSILWSSIEYSVAFVCICIPAMAPLLRNEQRRKDWKTGASNNWRSRDIEDYSQNISTKRSLGAEDDSDVYLPMEGYRVDTRATAAPARPLDGLRLDMDRVRVTTELDVLSTRNSAYRST